MEAEPPTPSPQPTVSTVPAEQLALSLLLGRRQPSVANGVSSLELSWRFWGVLFRAVLRLWREYLPFCDLHHQGL